MSELGKIETRVTSIKWRSPSTWAWWVWVAIVLGLVIVAPTAGRFVLNVLTRGARLTWTEADDNGDISESPDDLADDAANQINSPVDANEYALARMLASEEETSSQGTKVAIGWVAVNVAARRGESVTQLLTTDTNAHGTGKFGKQTGRWASTLYDPYVGDLTIAQAILQGKVPDPTGSAIHFYRPTLQDKLLALGKVNSSADDIDAAWGGNGFTVDGADSGITFYRAA